MNGVVTHALLQQQYGDCLVTRDLSLYVFWLKSTGAWVLVPSFNCLNPRQQLGPKQLNPIGHILYTCQDENSSNFGKSLGPNDIQAQVSKGKGLKWPRAKTHKNEGFQGPRAQTANLAGTPQAR